MLWVRRKTSEIRTSSLLIGLLLAVIFWFWTWTINERIAKLENQNVPVRILPVNPPGGN